MQIQGQLQITAILARYHNASIEFFSKLLSCKIGMF